jgi:hypothetical protein
MFPTINYPFHELKRRSWSGDLARPNLPMPNCQVKLVCGPPAAGKSTYVRENAGKDDIVIDLDAIAREHGYSRERPPEATSGLLMDRNDRIAALAKEPPWRVAWVIIGAPSIKLRVWWAQQLGVTRDDMVLLLPERAELHRRVMNDPDRADVWEHHIALIDQWLTRERENKPGRIQRGCDVSGFPTDPLHPWNDDEFDDDEDV